MWCWAVGPRGRAGGGTLLMNKKEFLAQKSSAIDLRFLMDFLILVESTRSTGTRRLHTGMCYTLHVCFPRDRSAISDISRYVLGFAAFFRCKTKAGISLWMATEMCYCNDDSQVGSS